MARKGENIYLRKDGRWEGRYMKGRRPDGKPRFGSVYGRQYGEVKKKLVLIKAELYKDGAVPLLYGDGSLHDWTEYWLEVTVRPYIKESTYEGYRRNIDKHIYPYLKDLPIREITSSQIQNAVDRLQSRLAASTLGGVWRLLRSVFTAAHNEGLLLRNPCQKIKIPKAGRRAPRVLTVPEQARLEQAAAEADEIEYLLCLYTGLRVGDDDDKIRLNQRKPSKYKGLSRFGPEKNLQRINKFMKERPTFYKKLIQMKENFRFYLRCFYCITKVVILQFNSEKQDRISS